MERHTLAHFLHDAGLATWFGGSLMGAVALNKAASTLDDPSQRSAVSTKGWTRWAPVSAVAIGAHLLGGAQLLRTEGHRVRRQDGVGASTAGKAGLTAAALGATAYSGVLNRKMAAAGRVPVESATSPKAQTPNDVATAQKQLSAIQWVIPGLTAGLIGVSSLQEEQMRPTQVAKGLLPSKALGPVAAAAAALGVVALLRSRKKPEPEVVELDTVVVVDEVVDLDAVSPMDTSLPTGPTVPAAPTSLDPTLR